MPSWAEAEERVLLDFNMKTLAPGDWTMEGYAFGTHNPIPNRAAKAGTRHPQAQLMSDEG